MKILSQKYYNDRSETRGEYYNITDKIQSISSTFNKEKKS